MDVILSAPRLSTLDSVGVSGVRLSCGYLGGYYHNQPSRSEGYLINCELCDCCSPSHAILNAIAVSRLLLSSQVLLQAGLPFC